MKKRVVIALVLIAMVFLVKTFVSGIIVPSVAPELSVRAVNGGDLAASNIRTYENISNLLNIGGYLLISLVALWALWPLKCFLGEGYKSVGKISKVGLMACLLPVILTGCKPYDVPEYDEIGNNETAFVLPLEGETKDQAKFQSEDFLRQAKVATKRVQILHRWNQAGRLWWSGTWLPTVRVIKVDRSPVTREWKAPETAEGHLAKGAVADQAIWVESQDSVGFSMGFSCSAYVKEEDAAKFLYWYPSGSLAKVMDQEVRARIQQNAAEVSAKYPLESLRAKKQEIADQVKTDTTSFFTARGISITTIGMFGGMTYENPKIQEAIDKVFVAQQLKSVAEAERDAQEKTNLKIKLSAEAEAMKKKLEAQGQADAIGLVNEALLKAQQNPLFIQLKALEATEKQIEKWNGSFPSYYMGGASSPAMLLQVPAPSPQPAQVVSPLASKN